MKDQNSSHRRLPVFVAGAGMLAGFGVFIARVKAYLLMAEDIKIAKINIGRAERSARAIKSHKRTEVASRVTV